MREQTPTAALALERGDRISAALRVIFEDLSGLSAAEIDNSTSFLEMGFDSLFLTQVTQAVQAKFGLKITFRQLLDRESTLEALAAYVDAHLPAAAFPAPTPPPQPAKPRTAAPGVNSNGQGIVHPAPGLVTVASTIPVALSTVEGIVRSQLHAMSELMSKQLDMLRDHGALVEPFVSLPVAEPARQTAAPASPAPAAPAGSARLAARDFKPFGPYKPAQKGPVGELTDRQDRYLKELIRRYTTRTARSKEYTQNHRRVLADPRMAAGFRSQWKEIVYPIVTTRSLGSRLWDLDGNEYIDILNGFGPIMLGHAPRFVTEAVENQLKQGFEIGPQAPLAGKVAALVCELTGMERATFCNTGSEAVMAAVRVARTVTARNRIVIFAGAYHGTFDEVLVKGIRKGGTPHSLPIAPGIPVDKVAHVTVLDFGEAESLEYIRAHAHELAAVLTEPVQSRHPALQPVEFLREIRKITESAGAALIFDEVVTGFRIHPGGAQALFGIRADLATYGKVVGGGLPIGILAGSARFMDALDGGMWQFGDDSFPETGVTFFAGTFVRHPLALAAAHAVLKHLKERGPTLQHRAERADNSPGEHAQRLFRGTRRTDPSRAFRVYFLFRFSARPTLRESALLSFAGKGRSYPGRLSLLPDDRSQ